LPSVGDAGGLDFERIRQYAPDLVLGWGGGNRAADLQRLARERVPLFLVQPRALADIGRQIRAIGVLAGTPWSAERAAQDFERRLQRLRERYAELAPLEVFVEIWHRPLFTVSAQHIISEVLEVCGARNAIAAYPLLAGPVPVEDVLRANPHAIVSVADVGQDEALEDWARFRQLRAVRNAALIAMSPDLLTRATPRLLDGAQILCERLAALRRAVGKVSTFTASPVSHLSAPGARRERH
ncbi:MAG: helical backbone metal receptor, partial [Burkholderiales bacterium]